MARDMDCVFREACRGNFRAFKGQKDQLLQLATSVHKDTILHIHLTGRPKFSIFQDMHLGRERKPSTTNLVIRILANPIKYFTLISLGLLQVVSRQDSSLTSVGFVKNVVIESRDLLWTTNAKDETPLHLAARYGHDDIVQVLLRMSRNAADSVDLEAARNLLDMVNNAGDTALHEAARYNHPQVVETLINEDPSYPYGPNKDGKTPLYLAAEMGNGKVVSQMLDSCTSPAYQGPDGKTALHAAVFRNDREVTRMIARKMKDLNKEADESGLTPLHYAAQEGFLRIVAILLREDKSAAYVSDKEHNMTALHIAAKRGRARVMWEIMSRCPHCCEQVDNNGRNLLHFVVEGNSKRALIAALSNRYVKLNLVNGEDNEGNRPLDKLPSTFNFLSYYDPYFTALGTSSKSGRVKASTMNSGMWEREDRRKLDALDVIDCKGEGGAEEERVITNEGRIDSRFEGVRETYLVVATLIATVTFAAALTMPGGYITDKGPDQGSPILVKSKAFKVFLVADIISMMLSSFAVFIHFHMIMFKKKRFVAAWGAAYFATFIALIMMVVGFCAGAYAVLSPSGTSLTSLCYVLPLVFAYILVMIFEVFNNPPMF